MKILSAKETKKCDAYTIQHAVPPITSTGLMEQAATVFADWFMELYPDTDRPVVVLCGSGNNGGDGLVVGRLLSQKMYDVQIIHAKIGSPSTDFLINRDRLPGHDQVPVHVLHRDDAFDLREWVAESSILIDALFGSGLNRPVSGYWAEVIQAINSLGEEVISIDCPSGLFADEPSSGATIRASRTLSFEFPKLAFFFPENEAFVGQWAYRSIGLNTTFIEESGSDNYLLDEQAIRMAPPRKRFTHKGDYGHGLLMAGQKGMAGAALLATRAMSRSGVGRVSVLTPEVNRTIIQIGAPEVMIIPTSDEMLLSKPIFPKGPIAAIGVGPGLGVHEYTKGFMDHLLATYQGPLVLDADALNILSENKDWLDRLPGNTILTPHPKEFERLFGLWENGFQRLDIQRDMSKKYQLIIVFKDAFTCISTPDGQVYFNVKGNAGMAKGGVGDVLTGLITGLLARGYGPEMAAKVGVHLHSQAGDRAAASIGIEQMKAGDLIDFLRN